MAATNFTLPVPAGSTNHGDPHLLCTPPSWTDYAVFFLTNYVAHVATVISSPGQGLPETLLTALMAFFFPCSGVVRAVRFIWWHASTERDALRRAARAGALCMVVRDSSSRKRGGDPEDAAAEPSPSRERDDAGCAEAGAVLDATSAADVQAGSATAESAQVDAAEINETGRLVQVKTTEGGEKSVNDDSEGKNVVPRKNKCGFQRSLGSCRPIQRRKSRPPSIGIWRR